VHWARLGASALGSLIAACPAWKKREEKRREMVMMVMVMMMMVMNATDDKSPGIVGLRWVCILSDTHEPWDDLLASGQRLPQRLVLQIWYRWRHRYVDLYHSINTILHVYFWYSTTMSLTARRGLGGATAHPGPSLFLAVPNVTAHLSTASVPITVLMYNGPLLCSFNVPIKGLTVPHVLRKLSVRYTDFLVVTFTYNQHNFH